ncbi:MAG: hypothetical protein HDR21_12485 [Lachnospiraceae bacterium]|nr:hypothetical protein [Lachnospiraceae bacterium]
MGVLKNIVAVDKRVFKLKVREVEFEKNTTKKRDFNKERRRWLSLTDAAVIYLRQYYKQEQEILISVDGIRLYPP